MGSGSFSSHYHQHDSASKQHDSKDRRQGNCFVGFRGGLDRASLEQRLMSCISDSAVDQDNNTCDDEDDSDNSGRFHASS